MRSEGVGQRQWEGEGTERKAEEEPQRDGWPLDMPWTPGSHPPPLKMRNQSSRQKMIQSSYLGTLPGGILDIQPK